MMTLRMVSMRDIRIIWAVRSQTRGTRCMPDRVLMAMATTAKIKPMAMSGSRFKPNMTMKNG